MDHSDNDILISAFLDGELNAEERARVEQLLAADAEARQLVEELRALRTGLQNLPRHKLEPEFAEAILQRVQQETEVEPVAKRQADGGSTEEVDPSPLHSAGPRFPLFRSRRSILWSAAAIAAAVLIAVSNRPADKGPQLARNDGDRNSHAVKEHELPEKLADNSRLNTTPAIRAIELNTAKPEAISQPMLAGKAGEHSASGQRIGGEVSGIAQDDSGKKGVVNEPAPTPMSLTAPVVAGDASGRTPSQNESFGISDAPAVSQPGAGVIAADSKKGIGAKADSAKFDSAKMKGDSIAASQAPLSPAGTGTLTLDGLRDKSPHAAIDEVVQQGQLFSKRLPNGDADVMVVCVDVSPEAARSGAFDALLAKHQIALQTASSNLGDQNALTPSLQLRIVTKEESDRSKDEQQAAGVTKTAAEPKSEDVASDDLKSGSPPMARGAEFKFNANREREEVAKQKNASAPAGAVAAAPAAGKIDMVYVEADAKQIEGTLADLHGDTKDFLAVTVGDASAANKLGFYRLNEPKDDFDVGQAQAPARAYRGGQGGAFGGGGSGNKAVGGKDFGDGGAGGSGAGVSVSGGSLAGGGGRGGAPRSGLSENNSASSGSPGNGGFQGGGFGAGGGVGGSDNTKSGLSGQNSFGSIATDRNRTDLSNTDRKESAKDESKKDAMENKPASPPVGEKFGRARRFTLPAPGANSASAPSDGEVTKTERSSPAAAATASPKSQPQSESGKPANESANWSVGSPPADGTAATTAAATKLGTVQSGQLDVALEGQDARKKSLAGPQRAVFVLRIVDVPVAKVSNAAVIPPTAVPSPAAPPATSPPAAVPAAAPAAVPPAKHD